MERVKKSVKLTSDELKAYKKWAAKQGTQIDAAAMLGVNRLTLNRVMLTGSGSQETINKIRKVIEA